MQRPTALEQAIYLLLMPAAVREFRRAPLPADVRLPLRVLAGDEEARLTAVDASAKSAETILRACEFYVREILLTPGATDYRALGCEPEASREELRANMILLMRWLHPDTAAGPRDGDLFERVRSAWQTLRSDESRAVYDQGLRERSIPPGGASAAVALRPATAAARRANPFLDRAPGSRRRRLLRRSIYITAAMLMFLLVVFLLDHLGIGSDGDIGLDVPRLQAIPVAARGLALFMASASLARLA